MALTVSSGASPPASRRRDVPDVVGSTQADAVQTLGAAGFVVVSTMEASESPAGEVISQSPTAGVIARAGSQVKIVVSSGPVTPSGSPSP